MVKIITINKVSRQIRQKLKKWRPWTYHTATTGSVYIKFRSPDLGTLRISDHEGKEKYRYRWRIRVDLPPGYMHRGIHKGVPYLEVGVGNLNGLVREFNNQAVERGITLDYIHEYKFVEARKRGR